MHSPVEAAIFSIQVSCRCRKCAWRATSQANLLGLLAITRLNSPFGVCLQGNLDEACMRFTGQKGWTDRPMHPTRCILSIEILFQTAGLRLQTPGYAAPIALRCWKHSRQNTGRPCVGRKGTVVSFPHCEQFVFVSERIGEA
jgi:hypothetical protein